MKVRLTIIIPAHNEEQVLEKTVLSIISSLKIKNYSILICNDHSTDKTLDIAKKLSKKYKQLKFTSNTNDAGFGNVLLFGFSQAKSELVVPMMADLCDDPRTIPLMLEKINQGYDIVCGSRYMKGGAKIGENALKDFFSRAVGMICHIFVGINTLDITNAFKMYKTSVLKDIQIKNRDFSVSMEIPLKAYLKRYRISEVPTTWTARKQGKSKFSISKTASSYLKLFLWALMKKI
jgi:glycosyltransferase involved in cell wall biosynthesis